MTRTFDHIASLLLNLRITPGQRAGIVAAYRMLRKTLKRSH